MKTRTLKEAYQNWIWALRSSQYTQGRIRLRSVENKFCCLGVLCDLRVNDGVGKLVYEPHGLAYDFQHKSGNLDRYSLSDEFRKSMFMLGAEMTKLIDMNDEGGSFIEISDYIEKKIMPRAIARQINKVIPK